MASAVIISPSPSIKKAFAIINSIDASKFPLLLSRIIKTLHSKDEKCFSTTEETKLQSSLNLSLEDVQLLLETLNYIFKQAAYHLAKPSVLSQQLLQLGMDADKENAIIQAWAASAKGTVEKLAQRSVAPAQLEEVNWKLHLQMANSKRAKLTQPVAIFEFGVRNDDTQSRENIFAEFSHEELYSFYDKLETIQAQIDSLS